MFYWFHHERSTSNNILTERNYSCPGNKVSSILYIVENVFSFVFVKLVKIK